MGGPLKLEFANHFIIYQKRPFREHFGTGRLHSELWAWGVKTTFRAGFGIFWVGLGEVGFDLAI